MTVLTALEEKETPRGCMAFNYIEDLRMSGKVKTTFGTETDRLLGLVSICA